VRTKGWFAGVVRVTDSICNFASGLVVPIPTFPSHLTRNKGLAFVASFTTKAVSLEFVPARIAGPYAWPEVKLDWNIAVYRFAAPFTSSFAVGLTVPIPTFPPLGWRDNPGYAAKGDPVCKIIACVPPSTPLDLKSNRGVLPAEVVWKVPIVRESPAVVSSTTSLVAGAVVPIPTFPPLPNTTRFAPFQKRSSSLVSSW